MSAHDKSTLFHKNLEWMRPRNPSLAERMKLWTESPDVALSLSKTEKTVPVVRQVSLHSRYDPEKEARQWFQNNTVDAASFIVFGLGFGYHLDVLLEHTTSSISVIEPSLDLFCHWANEVELSRYADRVHFIVGETAAKAVSLLQDTRQPVLSHPPSIRLHEAYFKAVEAGMEFDRLTAEHPLRVLVIPPIYGGSLPTARYCFDALEALGHRAYWADCDKMAQAFHAIKGFSANREHSEILSRKFLEFISEAVVARAEVVAAARGVELAPREIEEGAAGLELGEGAADEGGERVGAELGHAREHTRAPRSHARGSVVDLGVLGRGATGSADERLTSRRPRALLVTWRSGASAASRGHGRPSAPRGG